MKKPKCPYCGKTEICEGQPPEGCFLDIMLSESKAEKETLNLKIKHKEKKRLLSFKDLNEFWNQNLTFCSLVFIAMGLNLIVIGIMKELEIQKIYTLIPFFIWWLFSAWLYYKTK